MKGVYSVSVVDGKFVSVDSCYDIPSHLLLAPELKGNTQSPGFYFKEESTSARSCPDLLMLTQGWRRYDLTAIIQGKYKILVLEKHTEMVIRGCTLVAGGLPSKSNNEHLVTIAGTGSLKGFKRATFTDKDGYLCFDSIAYVDGGGFYTDAMQLNAERIEAIELFEPDYFKGMPLYPQTLLKDDSVQGVQREDVEMITRSDNPHSPLQDVTVRAPVWGSRDCCMFTDRGVVRYKDMRTLLKNQGLTISTLAEESEEMQLRVNADKTLAVRDTAMLLGDEYDAVESASSRDSQVEDMIYYGDQRILLFAGNNYCKPDILVNWIIPGDIESMVLVKDVDRFRADILL